MRTRRVAFPCALALACSLGLILQAQATARTPWGDPDLMGVWNTEAIVPFERPARYGEREFLTDEELASLEKARVEAERQAAATPQGRDVKKEGEKDVAQAYNQFWNPNLDGRPRRTGRRTSQIVGPEGRMSALTPDAKRRMLVQIEFENALLQGSSGGRKGPVSPRKREISPQYNVERLNRIDNPEDRATNERCMGSTLPLPVGFFLIVQSPGAVSINYDIGQGTGFSRVIPITNAPHLPPSVRQYYGDARGHWEGDTLVVDTTNFTQKTSFYGSRENLHLVERFRRIDPNTLVQRITIDDPTTFTKPWTIEREFARQKDSELLFESNCHEGNAGLLGMLANHRAAERLHRVGKSMNPDLMDTATGGGGEGSVALGPGVGFNPLPWYLKD